jgi:hypothetical protein
LENVVEGEIFQLTTFQDIDSERLALASIIERFIPTSNYGIEISTGLIGIEFALLSRE